MTENPPTLARYVFLDIVGFTKERCTEAQGEILLKMNRIIQETVEKHEEEYKEDEHLFLDRGDGVCIVLFDRHSEYDLHLKMAVHIQDLIHAHNVAADDDEVKFLARIGINENNDLVVEDINHHKTLIGNGIIEAQRVMNFADGGQILAAAPVYHKLSPYKKYKGVWSEYKNVTDKHEIAHDVYHYLGEHEWNQTNTPPKIAALILK